MARRKAGAPTPSVPVAESWRRIEAWMDVHLPVHKTTLKPGISRKDLAKFEKAIGQALPEDVRESWLIHDGQRPIPRDLLDEVCEDEDLDYEFPEFIGLIFGDGLLNLLTGECRGVGGSALHKWEGWAELAEEDFTEIDEECTSTPEGAIKLRYANRGWIPLGSFTDADFFGVDLDPGPRGVVGQVINFGRNEEEKCVLAPNWARFLSDVADELEAGNFAINLREEYKEFRMIRPRRGTLRRNYKEWSSAKLAGRLLM